MCGIEWPRWRDRVFRLVTFGTLQFVVLSFVAMLFYPGGNLADKQASGYRFFHNFFSDLGLTVAHNGQPNPVSSVLFLVSLSLAGLSLVLFSLFIIGLLARDWLTRLLAVAGSVAGVLSGIGFIGIAFTPADRFLTAHVDFVFLAFIAVWVAGLCHMTAIFLNPGYPNHLGFLYLLFVIVLGSYLFLLFSGPITAGLRGLTVQVGGQKAVVYAAVINFTIQAHGARRLTAHRTDRRAQNPGPLGAPG